MDRGELRDRMKTQDQGRKWMWGLLGAIALFQMYFVRSGSAFGPSKREYGGRLCTPRSDGSR